MQVGTTKDRGLYNKPSAAVHPGTLAAGTLPQYNTIQLSHVVIFQNSVLVLIPNGQYLDCVTIAFSEQCVSVD